MRAEDFVCWCGGVALLMAGVSCLGIMVLAGVEMLT